MICRRGSRLPTASSVPYFAAIEHGFFKEQGIEPETIRLIGGPPNIAASDVADAAHAGSFILRGTPHARADC